jgi:hypothetical protein
MRLILPPGTEHHWARCGGCRARFRLPKPLPVPEDTVAGWLWQQEEDDQPAAPAASPKPAPKPRAAAPEPPAAKTLAPAPAPRRALPDLRLVGIDRKGVLLEFDAARLKDTAFRTAMPRRCMQCGARTHLEAHVIIFTAALVDSVSLEAERSAGSLVLRPEDVRDLGPEALLDRLPRVPNVPPPADLPMPYWLCDMCSASGAVSGQIQARAETGQGRCRLLISNRRRAEEFLANVGARGTAPHRQVIEAVAKTAERPWDSLPLVVQHRIEQWYKPRADEEFLAYVPDRDHSRTEDGMSGLLLSSRRLVYHTRLRHHESPAGEPLEFRLAMSRMHGQLEVRAPSWQARRLRVDKDGISRLRRALAKGRFRAAWP